MKKDKFYYFNHFVAEIADWYEGSFWSLDKNDLWKLKILLLLFLACSTENQSLEVFDNFEAWDLWVFEGDLFQALQDEDERLEFEINHKTLLSKPTIVEKEPMTTEMVNNLKEKNPDLIKMLASHIVDIIMKWDSWRITKQFWNKRVTNALIINSHPYYK